MSCSRGCFASPCCRKHDERLIQWCVGCCPLLGREVRRHAGRWRRRRRRRQQRWEVPRPACVGLAAVALEAARLFAHAARGSPQRPEKAPKTAGCNSCAGATLAAPLKCMSDLCNEQLVSGLCRARPAAHAACIGPFAAAGHLQRSLALHRALDLRSISLKHSGRPKWTWTWPMGSRKCRRRAPRGT